MMRLPKETKVNKDIVQDILGNPEYVQTILDVVKYTQRILPRSDVVAVYVLNADGYEEECNRLAKEGGIWDEEDEFIVTDKKLLEKAGWTRVPSTVKDEQIWTKNQVFWVFESDDFQGGYLLPGMYVVKLD